MQARVAHVILVMAIGNKISFFNFLFKTEEKNETWTLFKTELSISKKYKVDILF